MNNPKLYIKQILILTEQGVNFTLLSETTYLNFVATYKYLIGSNDASLNIIVRSVQEYYINIILFNINRNRIFFSNFLINFKNVKCFLHIKKKIKVLLSFNNSYFFGKFKGK